MGYDADLEAFKHVPLPLVPGMGVSEAMMQARPRSQRLKYVNGIAGPFDATRRTPAPAPAARPASAHQRAAAPVTSSHAAHGYIGRGAHHHLGRPRTAAAAQAAPAPRPAWLAFDGVCLRFFGYFEDMETTKRTGLRRVRRCTVTLYLEDNTVDIREPKQENSGIVQGQLLKRMRVQKPDGSTYTPGDFVVGSSVRLYARTYIILACDE
eukprot:CAMPEP_0181396184 /NCGR_PEP_ID=MMETSP1106-20121128/28739_1 /TAXON_ID=81844 /ORGANISM="Mantoniella antarctica, Strain SL-175" /LENGTH=208 /DNA_ID=CAMNT_0023517857 /DNA_START=33 /DNA_END=656 /DNA_ORIENTATION=+